MTDTGTAAPQSFAEFFAVEVAPGLPALEAARRDRKRNAYTRAVGAAFAVVVAALIAWLAWHIAAGAAVLIVGGICGLLLARRPARRHQQAIRDAFIPPLLRYLQAMGNVEYHRKPGNRFDLARLRRSGIVAPYTRATLEDLFEGTHRGTGFRLVEARLVRKRKTGNGSDRASTRRRTVFAGLLCEVGVPAPFEGVVLLFGDKGPLGNWLREVAQRSFAGIAPVSLDDAAFETRYRVFSDNPDAARQLLQPGLRETLLALSDDLGGESLNCAFFEGRFLMAIPHRQNLFEIGRLNRSLEHAEEDLRRLATEFTIAQRLIDNLHGERKPLLPAK